MPFFLLTTGAVRIWCGCQFRLSSHGLLCIWELQGLWWTGATSRELKWSFISCYHFHYLPAHSLHASKTCIRTCFGMSQCRHIVFYLWCRSMWWMKTDCTCPGPITTLSWQVRRLYLTTVVSCQPREPSMSFTTDWVSRGTLRWVNLLNSVARSSQEVRSNEEWLIVQHCLASCRFTWIRSTVTCMQSLVTVRTRGRPWF